MSIDDKEEIVEIIVDEVHQVVTEYVIPHRVKVQKSKLEHLTMREIESIVHPRRAESYEAGMINGQKTRYRWDRMGYRRRISE